MNDAGRYGRILCEQPVGLRFCFVNPLINTYIWVNFVYVNQINKSQEKSDRWPENLNLYSNRVHPFGGLIIGAYMGHLLGESGFGSACG